MLIGVPLLVVCPCFLCTDDYRDRGKAGENLRKRIQSALRRRNRLHESPTASSSADSPSIVFSLPSVAPSTLKPDVTNTVETADDGDAASISVGRVPHTTGPGPSGHARTGTQANAAMSREVPAPAASRIFTRLANIRSRYWRGLRSAFLWVKFKTLGVRFTMAQRTQTTEPRTVEERETKEEKPEYELSKY
ncbi:hypothetical protein BaRGS_00012906 [Batillaria attramentaria]|uniref:Secreted protein n=1 Tax=Batillaria attramentaria TaxID=370345 RepID=A0ABD0L9E1_9CAEN